MIWTVAIPEAMELSTWFPCHFTACSKYSWISYEINRETPHHSPCWSDLRSAWVLSSSTMATSRYLGMCKTKCLWDLSLVVWFWFHLLPPDSFTGLQEVVIDPYPWFPPASYFCRPYHVSRLTSFYQVLSCPTDWIVCSYLWTFYFPLTLHFHAE